MSAKPFCVPLAKSALLHLDLETTGLLESDEPWQVAYSVDLNGRAVIQREFFLKHEASPDAWVLEKTRYLQTRTKFEVSPLAFAISLAADLRFAGAERSYLVGVKTEFDNERLEKLFATVRRALPYDYHLLDVGQTVRSLFHLPEAPGLDATLSLLRLRREGEAHDAWSDMLASRAAHYRLDEIERRIAPAAWSALDEIAPPLEVAA